MRIYRLLAVFLPCAMAMAQGPGFNDRQSTTGMVGMTPGQTARLNVLYPTVPAPLALINCAATLTLFDDQGNVLKTASFAQLIPGRPVSISANGDTDLPTQTRTEVYGLSFTSGCSLVSTLEIIDNATQKTVVTVMGQETYPFRAAVPLARGSLMN